MFAVFVFGIRKKKLVLVRLVSVPPSHGSGGNLDRSFGSSESWSFTCHLL